jgi:hypothetical protein
LEEQLEQSCARKKGLWIFMIYSGITCMRRCSRKKRGLMGMMRGDYYARVTGFCVVNGALVLGSEKPLKVTDGYGTNMAILKVLFFPPFLSYCVSPFQ